MRTAQYERNTSETQISVKLDLDGSGAQNIKTNCGFFNHMLQLFARHGRFGLAITARGDVEVDFHHTVEDSAIALGRAFSLALEERRGIRRYGFFALPMDEALVLAAVDISGRSNLGYALNFPSEKIGDFDTELVQVFFDAFARELGASIHLQQLAGQNSHHIAEAAFKGFGRALAEAVSLDPAAEGEIPSTKGTIV